MWLRNQHTQPCIVSIGLVILALRVVPVVRGQQGPDTKVCASHHTGHCSACESCCIDFSSQDLCNTCVTRRCSNKCVPTLEDDGSQAPCSVCKSCCDPMFANQTDCDSCASTQCATTDPDEFDCLSVENTCSPGCVKHCIMHGSDSPCISDCHTAHGVEMFFLACLPFAGRIMFDTVLPWVFKRMRKKSSSESEESLNDDGSDDGKEKITMMSIFEGSKHSCSMGGLMKGVIRLVFWHWLQPLVYFIVLRYYWELLNTVQQVFGAIVAARELFYLVCTIVALFANIDYLQVDLIATLEDGCDGVACALMYWLAPEMFVWAAISTAWCCDGGDKTLISSCCGFCMQMLMEGSAIAALIVGHMDGNMPLPLAVGYIVTALAFVFSFPMFLFVIYEIWRDDGDEGGDDDDGV
eukprot:COSAG01_NODE_562_length_15456_cov_24.731458_2_plen_409_part_00